MSSETTDSRYSEIRKTVDAWSSCGFFCIWSLGTKMKIRTVGEYSYWLICTSRQWRKEKRVRSGSSLDTGVRIKRGPNAIGHYSGKNVSHLSTSDPIVCGRCGGDGSIRTTRDEPYSTTETRTRTVGYDESGPLTESYQVTSSSGTSSVSESSSCPGCGGSGYYRLSDYRIERFYHKDTIHLSGNGALPDHVAGSVTGDQCWRRDNLEELPEEIRTQAQQQWRLMGGDAERRHWFYTGGRCEQEVHRVQVKVVHYSFGSSKIRRLYIFGEEREVYARSYPISYTRVVVALACLVLLAVALANTSRILAKVQEARDWMNRDAIARMEISQELLQAERPQGAYEYSARELSVKTRYPDWEERMNSSEGIAELLSYAGEEGEKSDMNLRILRVLDELECTRPEAQVFIAQQIRYAPLSSSSFAPLDESLEELPILALRYAVRYQLHNEEIYAAIKNRFYLRYGLDERLCNLLLEALHRLPADDSPEERRLKGNLLETWEGERKRIDQYWYSSPLHVAIHLAQIEQLDRGLSKESPTPGLVQLQQEIANHAAFQSDEFKRMLQSVRERNRQIQESF